jgi:hypothetical protein
MQRPSDALLLAAGQLLRLALQQFRSDFDGRVTYDINNARLHHRREFQQ